MESGRCVDDDFKNASAFGDDDSGATELSCPPGTVYCLATGQCIPYDNGFGSIYDDDDNLGYMCRPGTVYCLESGSCQMTSYDDNDDFVSLDDLDDDENSMQCPIGWVYCMQKSRCQQSCDDSDNEDDDITDWMDCSHGMVYCMETSQCQRSCHQDMDDDNNDKGVHCPEDQVLLLINFPF